MAPAVAAGEGEEEEGGWALREKPMFSKVRGEGMDQYPAEEEVEAVEAGGESMRCGSAGSCDGLRGEGRSAHRREGKKV